MSYKERFLKKSYRQKDRFTIFIYTMGFKGDKKHPVMQDIIKRNKRKI